MSNKLNWFEYYVGHCWMTGWQNIRGSFRIWSDLMTGNYKDYALTWYDDPYEECVGWFWSQLGEDDTLSKDFLEHLMQLAENVRTGKEKTIPMEDVMKHLEWADKVLEGVNLDDELMEDLNDD